MKLAFIAAAWLIGVLIGLETRTPLAPILLLPGGSITLGLALGSPACRFPSRVGIVVGAGRLAGRRCSQPLSGWFGRHQSDFGRPDQQRPRNCR